jgi:hypothetical protein
MDTIPAKVADVRAVPLARLAADTSCGDTQAPVAVAAFQSSI